MRKINIDYSSGWIQQKRLRFKVNKSKRNDYNSKQRWNNDVGPVRTGKESENLSIGRVGRSYNG